MIVSSFGDNDFNRFLFSRSVVKTDSGPSEGAELSAELRPPQASLPPTNERLWVGPDHHPCLSLMVGVGGPSGVHREKEN